jgi:hypothetical protein
VRFAVVFQLFGVSSPPPQGGRVTPNHLSPRNRAAPPCADAGCQRLEVNILVLPPALQDSAGVSCGAPEAQWQLGFAHLRLKLMIEPGRIRAVVPQVSSGDPHPFDSAPGLSRMGVAVPIRRFGVVGWRKPLRW